MNYVDLFNDKRSIVFMLEMITGVNFQIKQTPKMNCSSSDYLENIKILLFTRCSFLIIIDTILSFYTWNNDRCQHSSKTKVEFEFYVVKLHIKHMHMTIHNTLIFSHNSHSIVFLCLE